MAVTDAARNQLFNTLRETLGADDAATMMDLLPPIGWADVARQRDVDRLEANVERRFDELDRRLELRFDSLDQRFATKDDLREMMRSFVAWTIASNATLVATITLVTSLR